MEFHDSQADLLPVPESCGYTYTEAIDKAKADIFSYELVPSNACARANELQSKKRFNKKLKDDLKSHGKDGNGKGNGGGGVLAIAMKRYDTKARESKYRFMKL